MSRELLGGGRQPRLVRGSFDSSNASRSPTLRACVLHEISVPACGTSIRTAAKGLIRHLGLSGVSSAQLTEAQAIALIPGTSSTAHLKDNIAAADVRLPAAAIAGLGKIGDQGK